MPYPVCLPLTGDANRPYGHLMYEGPCDQSNLVHVFTWKLLFREAGEPKLYLIYTSFLDLSVLYLCSTASEAAIQTRGRRALWRGPSGAHRASGQKNNAHLR